MRILLPTLLVTLAIGVGVSAAQTGSQTGPMTRPMSTPQGDAPGQSGTIFSEGDVLTKLRAEGYSNVSDLKREGNKYSAMATKDGQRLSLVIDARTGEVISNTVR